jgi:hypothetical protein
MTIETATPSSAETIAALFDTLVDAVAARVLAQLDDNFNARLERFAEEELDGRIDDWAANFLDDRVKEHVSSDTDDLHDQVLEIVQGLNYDVRVHVSS